MPYHGNSSTEDQVSPYRRGREQCVFRASIVEIKRMYFDNPKNFTCRLHILPGQIEACLVMGCKAFGVSTIRHMVYARNWVNMRPALQLLYEFYAGKLLDNIYNNNEYY